jgi:predicted HicB family RNase H-like nuclease
MEDRYQTTVRVRRETWRQLRYRAADEETSIQTVIDRALELYLKTALPSAKAPKKGPTR